MLAFDFCPAYLHRSHIFHLAIVSSCFYISLILSDSPWLNAVGFGAAWVRHYNRISMWSWHNLHFGIWQCKHGTKKNTTHSKEEQTQRVSASIGTLIQHSWAFNLRISVSCQMWQTAFQCPCHVQWCAMMCNVPEFPSPLAASTCRAFSSCCLALATANSSAAVDKFRRFRWDLQISKSKDVESAKEILGFLMDFRDSKSPNIPNISHESLYVVRKYTQSVRWVAL